MVSPLGCATAVCSGDPGVHESTGLTVTIWATPTNGSAPLLVAFSTAVQPAGRYAISWSFGDGSFSNGSWSSLASPSHWYGLPGTFNATASVTNGSATATARVAIRVLSVPLAAVATADPSSGPAPLNVTFAVSPHGGTGTYRSYRWDFNDGSNGSGLVVDHWFRVGGDFRVTVEVVDSAGHAVLADVWVNVTNDSPTSSPASWGGWPGGLAGYVLVPALCALAAGALGLGWSWRRQWRARSSGPSSEGEGVGAARPVALAPVGPAPETPPEPLPPSGVGPRVAFASSAVPDLPEVQARSLQTPEGLRRARRATEELLSYLYQRGRLRPEELGERSRTQAGIASATGMRQSSVSTLLRRLVAAGAVGVDTRHVRGETRRLRVYYLTARGESIARGLREATEPRRSPSPPE